MAHGKDKVLDTLAKVISVVTLPNFIISYLIGFPLLVDPFERWRLYAILLVGVAPTVLSLLYWRLIGMKDTFVVGRKQRYLPFLFSFLGAGAVYLLTPYMVAHAYDPDFATLRFLMAMYLIVSSVGFLVTLFWKISLHMLGLSPLLGVVLGGLVSSDTLTQGELLLILPWVAFLLLPLVVVAWARWRLRSHDKWQLLAGFLLGLALGFALTFPLLEWVDPWLP